MRKKDAKGLELVYKDIQDMIGGDGDNDPCVDRNGGNEASRSILSSPGTPPTPSPSDGAVRALCQDQWLINS